MEHSVLTATPFFKILKQQENNTGMGNAYDEFIEEVCELCCNTLDLKVIMLTLTYTEIELQHMLSHCTNPHPDISEHLPYIQKALTFISKIMDRLLHCHQQLPPPFPIEKFGIHPQQRTPLKWTGNRVDLAELIYALHETGCINKGKIPLKELESYLYSFFCVDSKDCYRFYTDIKRRKKTSRTYFIDTMQELLNV